MQKRHKDFEVVNLARAIFETRLPTHVVEAFA